MAVFQRSTFLGKVIPQTLPRSARRVWGADYLTAVFLTPFARISGSPFMEARLESDRLCNYSYVICFLHMLVSDNWYWGFLELWSGLPVVMTGLLNCAPCNWLLVFRLLFAVFALHFYMLQSVKMCRYGVFSTQVWLLPLASPNILLYSIPLYSWLKTINNTLLYQHTVIPCR